MDVMKIVVIVVLAALAIAAFGVGLSALQTGQERGEEAFSFLKGNWHAGETDLGESPITIGQRILSVATGHDDEDEGQWNLVAKAFAAAVAVILGMFGLRLAFRLGGG